MEVVEMDGSSMTPGVSASRPSLREACVRSVQEVAQNVRQNVSLLSDAVTTSAVASRTSWRAPSRRKAGRQSDQALAAQLASVSVASQHPVLDLALETTEIRSQLSSVPIYTVVTDSNELVLVDRESGDRHLGLIFFDRSDAEALATTVRSASAALSSRVRVREMPLDELYDHLFERDRTLDDVRPAVDFRMVPARAAVRDALATLEAGGKAAAAFSGVPLFQAGGLVVQNEGQPVTPLFLSKADLDAAVRTAADKARQRRRARRGEEAEVLGRGLETGSATDGEEDPLESLEIGIESLESVVQRMQSSLTSEWNNVYFVGEGTMGAGPGEAAGRKPWWKFW